MDEIEKRLAAIEQRLKRVESAISWGPPKKSEPPKVGPVSKVDSKIGDFRRYRESGTDAEPVRRSEPRSLAPQVLGISGVAAFILAASYLVRLAIDSGWLTPERQIGIAAVAGIGMIVGGLLLRGSGARYASLLSSAGIVVCFFTIYSAHLLFGFIGSSLATSLIGALCLLALWLGQVFDTKAYAFIAVLGAYSTPFLVQTESPSIIQLVQYYSAWSVLFCTYSIWVGGRHAYLVASVLALVGFDLIWRESFIDSWKVAVYYQASQFLLFTATTALYSVKHRSPLSRIMALVHAPSLFFFYVVEYAILDRHIPEWAPWISLASVLVVATAYLLARPRLESATAGATLANWYTNLALFHAGYVELLPTKYHPWLALAIFITFGLAKARTSSFSPTVTPYLISGGLICAFNYLRILGELQLNEIPMLEVLYVAYPLALYVAYAASENRAFGRIRYALLYAAHVSAMIAVDRLVDTSVIVSILWGSIAVGSLLIAVRRNNRTLAQSSFLVFIASGIKVMVFDLAESSTLVKIGCLVAVGASLYVGGWLYQRLDRVKNSDESSNSSPP